MKKSLNNNPNYVIPLKWTLLHVALGVAVVHSQIVAQLWGIGALIVVLIQIIRNRTDNSTVAVGVAYLASQEVLLKVCNAEIGSEFIKYIVVIYLVASMMLSKAGFRRHKIWLLFLLLLIPSTIYSVNSMNWFENIRYSLSGIVVLAVSAYFFMGRVVTLNTYKKILGAIILPMIALSIAVTLDTPDFSEVEFTATSMSETTGGFGPVHLSVVLGTGVLILSLMSILRQPLIVNLAGNYIVMCFFVYRLLLSFSRSGLVAFMASLFVLVLYMVINRTISLKQIVVWLSIIVIAGSIIWDKVDDITRGMATYRYSGRDTSGEKLDDVSSGRVDLFKEELEMFAENPVMGIGAGVTPLERSRRYGQIHSSHTEYSRLLCEHGILGIIMNMILIGVPIVFYKKTQGMSRYYFIAFIVYSLLSLVTASTRTTLPLFVYGLAFLQINDNHKVALYDETH